MEHRFDLVEGIDYVFSNVNGLAGIELLSSEYKGVVFLYRNASVSEDNGQAFLSFDYDIITHNNFTDKELKSVEFKVVLGNILMSVMMKSLEGNNDFESESEYFEESEL